MASKSFGIFIGTKEKGANYGSAIKVFKRVCFMTIVVPSSLFFEIIKEVN